MRILFHCPPQVPSPQKAQKGKKDRAESGRWGLLNPLGRGPTNRKVPIWCSVAATPWGVSSGSYLDLSKTRHIFIIRNFQFILNKLLNFEQMTLPQLFL